MCTVFPTNKTTHAIHPNETNCPHTIYPNDINRSTRNPSKRHQPSMRNSLKRNRRGGACVPARTSAQRRFHAKNTRIVCRDFNNGCAPAGRLGRAHRHRPYQTPPYFSTQSHTNKITIYTQSTQTKSTVYTQSSPTTSNIQTKRVYNPPHTHRGRKCIAHSRPHSLKQVVYANWHRDDALLF